MGKISPRDEAAFAALDRLYAQLPTIACQRKCAIACGALPLTDLEARRLQLAAHRKPRTIPVTLTPAGESRARPVERCVYLRDERQCSVYAVRPLICRVWGVVKALSCPHGCVPDRWLSDRAFLQLAIAVERLGGGRVIRTAPEGLVAVPDEGYARIGSALVVAQRAGVARTDAQLAENAELTRSLRAIFGGRIIAAIDERPR